MPYERFENTILSRALIEAGDKILVALSGGSDSVAMLVLLCEFAKKHSEMNLTIEALHFNHLIRGEDAFRDENFCVELCKKLNVPLTVKCGDVPEYSKATGKSLEEAARDLRYFELKKRASELGENSKIAVAHNKNDRAETILFNIARGSGIDGLRGIRYKRDNIIRPLLDIEKEETYKIVEAAGLSYVTDNTNFEEVATRNKIRLKILPYVSELLDTDFSQKLNSLSDLAEQDGEALDEIAENAAKASVKNNEIEIDELLSYHAAIGSRIVRRCIANFPAYNANVSISSSMIKRTLDFAKNGRNGGIIELGKGVFAEKYAGKLKFFEKPAENDGNFDESLTKNEFSLKATVKKEGEFDINQMISLSRKDNSKLVVFDLDELSKDIDPDKIVIRTMAEGDVFAGFGAPGEKPLRRFFTDIKLPGEERKKAILLANGSKILHIFGVRRSKTAPLTKNTKNVIIYEIAEN